MNKPYTAPENLESFSFLWLMGALALSTLAMLLGAQPISYVIFSATKFSSIAFSLTNSAWIISGLAAAYLLYTWMRPSNQLFGGENDRDKMAFVFMIALGLILGITGTIGTNFFLMFFGGLGYLIYGPAAFACGGVFYHLYVRWNESGHQLFTPKYDTPVASPVTPEPTPEPAAATSTDSSSSENNENNQNSGM